MIMALTAGELITLLRQYPETAKVYFADAISGQEYKIENVSQFIDHDWGGWLTLTGDQD